MGAPPPETTCRRVMTGDLRYYPQAKFRGRRLYFCTEYCLRAFLEDPERFHAAHSKRRVDPKTCEFAKSENT